MLRAVISAVLIFGVVSAVALPVRAAQPVARVLSVDGTVNVERAGEQPRPVSPFGTIYLDDRLVVDADASVVLAFRETGRMERLRGPGSAQATHAGFQSGDLVDTLKIAGAHLQLVSGSVRGLPPVTVGGVTVVRGDDEDDPKQLIQPAIGATILSRRPEFRWPAVPDAVAYDVYVFDAVDDLWSTTTKTTSIAYAGDQPFGDGKEFGWEVVARSGRDAELLTYEGTFTVATCEVRQRAEEWKEMVSGEDTTLLSLAMLWYRQQGLIDEALSTAARLVKLNPQEPAHHDMLAMLLFQVGRRQAARQAAEQAKRLNTGMRQP